MKINFEERINQIIAQQIRPVLQQHGGNIKVKKIDDGNVWVVFEGTCKTCPSAQITIEETVTTILRNELNDELKNVYLTTETDEELLSFAKKLLSINSK